MFGYASANTLVILYMVTGFCWFGGVSLHDIIIHEGSTSEETKAARATEHTAKHMLCCLLQPVAHCVLKFLIPHHRTLRPTIITGMKVDAIISSHAELLNSINRQDIHFKVDYD